MLSAPHQVPQLHSRLGPTQTLTGNLGFRSAVITKLGTYTARNAHLSARVISSYDHKWFPVVKKTQETYGEKNCQTYGYSLSSSQKSNWKLEKEFGFSLLILVLLFEINGFFSLYFQYLQRNYPLRCSISRKVSNSFISTWKVFFFSFLPNTNISSFIFNYCLFFLMLKHTLEVEKSVLPDFFSLRRKKM